MLAFPRLKLMRSMLGQWQKTGSSISGNRVRRLLRNGWQKWERRRLSGNHKGKAVEKIHGKVTMKNESAISAKGQTTVPAEIWKLFDCAPGTRLDWNVLDDGRLMVRVMTSTRTVEKS